MEGREQEGCPLGFRQECGNPWECGREQGNGNMEDRMNVVGFRFPSYDFILGFKV